ncbi:MAG: gliding motility protein GldC [Bacteroidetes bacterium]|jgi:gliding motility-associated protein GldC|nr:gliding motility protein GldC [Bacteroidota bacterium]
MQTSTISIDVLLDNNRIPEQINWQASDSTADMKQKAKAMCLAFWDAADRSALRIDLWTKDMMVDEMGDFFYQMLVSLADTFQRATQQQELSEEMKTFAKEFIEKFRANELSKQQ